MTGWRGGDFGEEGETTVVVVFDSNVVSLRDLKTRAFSLLQF